MSLAGWPRCGATAAGLGAIAALGARRRPDVPGRGVIFARAGLVFKALLPPLVWEPPFSEYVAYIGIIGLALAAAGAWTTLRKSEATGSAERGMSSHKVAALILAALGIFLAFGLYNPVYYLLYKLVPGIGLFAPRPAGCFCTPLALQSSPVPDWRPC